MGSQTSEGSSVLIVEDEAELREILSFDFESAGFHVFAAENAVKALELLAINPITAIVSDIRMANGDGIQLLNSIKSDKVKNGLNLILVTGYSDFSVEEALDQGVDGFHFKPFGRRKLVDTVNRLSVPFEERIARGEGWENEEALPEIKLTFRSFEQAKKESRFNFGRGGFFVAFDGSVVKVDEKIKFDINFENENIRLKGAGAVRWIRNGANTKEKSGFGLEVYFLDEKCFPGFKKIYDGSGRLAFIPKT